MKKILTILFILIIPQLDFAQTKAYKFAEYDRNGGGGCEEYFRIVNFAERLEKENSKGLIVVI